MVVTSICDSLYINISTRRLSDFDNILINNILVSANFGTRFKHVVERILFN